MSDEEKTMQIVEFFRSIGWGVPNNSQISRLKQSLVVLQNILKAGHSEEVEDKLPCMCGNPDCSNNSKADLYGELIRKLNNRVCDLEAKSMNSNKEIYGVPVHWQEKFNKIDAFMNRLVELEKASAMHGNYIFNMTKATPNIPSSLEQRLTRLEAGLRAMDIEVNGIKVFEPEKPVTEEKLSGEQICMKCKKTYCNFECPNYEEPSKPSECDTDKLINDFIKKWCGNMSAHLLDSDGNDGERLREAIKQSLAKKG